jgi:hypothetical protein
VIIAIGGSASVGKTTLAATLADTLGINDVAHVDDLVPDVERSSDPSFISSTPDVWRRPGSWLCDQLIEWTLCLHPRIEQLVIDLTSRGGGIIEGEGIDPRLASRWPADALRVVYIVETDPSVLDRTFAARSSGTRFLALSPTERAGVVEMNLRYGRWLRDSADAQGQPSVRSQPWATLADRALEALDL